MSIRLFVVCIWYCSKHTVYSLYQSFLGATNGEKVVGTIVYFIIYSIHNSKGPVEPRGQGGICPLQSLVDRFPYSNQGGALCVQMDFKRILQTNTNCHNINHVSSHFYKILVVLKYHRRLGANIFDTIICRSMNIPKKAKYTPLMWVFMHVKMSVS